MSEAQPNGSFLPKILALSLSRGEAILEGSWRKKAYRPRSSLMN